MGDHTESIKVTYDSSKLTYKDILNTFWSTHQPFGRSSRQYRSAIFYHNDEQRALAEETKKQKEAESGRVVTTAIEEAGAWYDAEEYHQKYLAKMRR